VVYRELSPRGLTALDPMDEATLGARPRNTDEDSRLSEILERLQIQMGYRESTGNPGFPFSVVRRQPRVRRHGSPTGYGGARVRGGKRC